MEHILTLQHTFHSLKSLPLQSILYIALRHFLLQNRSRLSACYVPLVCKIPEDRYYDLFDYLLQCLKYSRCSNCSQFEWMGHEASIGEDDLEKQDRSQSVVKGIMVKYVVSGVDSLDSKPGSTICYWVALGKLLSISECHFPYLSKQED